MITPILTVSCAIAAPGVASNASAAALLRNNRLSIGFLLRQWGAIGPCYSAQDGDASVSGTNAKSGFWLEYCMQSMDFQLSLGPPSKRRVSWPLEARQHLGWNGARAQPVVVFGVAHGPQPGLVAFERQDAGLGDLVPQ